MTTEEGKQGNDYSQFGPVELQTQMRSLFQLVPKDPINIDNDTPPTPEDIDLVNSLPNNPDPMLRSMLSAFKAGAGIDVLNYAAYKTIANMARRQTGELAPALKDKFKALLSFSSLSQPIQGLLADSFGYSVDLGDDEIDKHMPFNLLGSDPQGAIFEPDKVKDSERKLIAYYKRRDEFGMRMMKALADESGNPRKTNYSPEVLKAIEEFVAKYHEEP